jgi:hypothetical protein
MDNYINSESIYSASIDCGIDMLHIEIASLVCGFAGEWEFLGPPKVARFNRLS